MTILVAVRWLHFAAVAVAFGGAGFLAALRRKPSGSMAVIRTASIMAGITGAAWFALVFAGIAGGASALADPDAWWAFASAPFGTPWLVRLALCVAALALGFIRSPRPILALGATMVIDQAWLGHAAGGPVMALAFYMVHVGAGFAWVGALVMLCAVARVEQEVPSDGLRLFHRHGVALVSTLIAAGLVEAAARGLAPADLVTTTYGRIIAAKILGLIAMLALALHHRSHPPRAMRATLPIETAVALCVVGLAAALGVTPPR